jgi:dUTPase
VLSVLEVFVPKTECFHRETQPGHFGFLIPLNQHAKKGASVLAGVIGPDYQGQVELLLHNGDREDCTQNTGDSSASLMLPSL